MNRWLPQLPQKALPSLCVAVCCALGMVACGAMPERAVSAQTGHGAVWPPPPDEPRLQYKLSLRNPADLGIEPRWWQRIASFFVGSAPDRLVQPSAVLETAGVIFVADPGVQGVHRFDVAAQRHVIIRGPGGGALPSPVGLAAGPGGSVLISDSSLAQVLMVRPDGEEATVLPLSPAPQQPTGIAYAAARGEIFVVDTARHGVAVYSVAGKLLRNFGTRGNGAGQFNFPTLLTLAPSQDMLWVTDSLNFRLQALTLDGVAIRSFGQAGDNSGDLPRPKGVALDRAGHVYVVDAVLPGLQVFDSSGRLLLALGGLGNGPGEFRLPTGIHISPSDTIFVADTFNQRVQVFRYIGSP